MLPLQITLYSASFCLPLFLGFRRWLSLRRSSHEEQEGEKKEKWSTFFASSLLPLMTRVISKSYGRNTWCKEGDWKPEKCIWEFLISFCRVSISFISILEGKDINFSRLSSSFQTVHFSIVVPSLERRLSSLSPSFTFLCLSSICFLLYFDSISCSIDKTNLTSREWNKRRETHGASGEKKDKTFNLSSSLLWFCWVIIF